MAIVSELVYLSTKDDLARANARISALQAALRTLLANLKGYIPEFQEPMYNEVGDAMELAERVLETTRAVRLTTLLQR